MACHILIYRNCDSKFFIHSFYHSRKDDTDLVYSFKSSNIKFYPEEIIPWTLDGEFGGDHKEVEIRNMHQALEIMVKNKETSVK